MKSNAQVSSLSSLPISVTGAWQVKVEAGEMAIRGETLPLEATTLPVAPPPILTVTMEKYDALPEFIT